jgi:K+/H+ antiporter YhaU regulatory subunit KhtT
MVVGMEHQGKRILNPETDQHIRSGDLLWIVGETQKLDELQDLLKVEDSDQLM